MQLRNIDLDRTILHVPIQQTPLSPTHRHHSRKALWRRRFALLRLFILCAEAAKQLRHIQRPVRLSHEVGERLVQLALAKCRGPGRILCEELAELVRYLQGLGREQPPSAQETGRQAGRRDPHARPGNALSAREDQVRQAQMPGQVARFNPG